MRKSIRYTKKLVKWIIREQSDIEEQNKQLGRLKLNIRFLKEWISYSKEYRKNPSCYPDTTQSRVKTGMQCAKNSFWYKGELIL